VLEFTITASDHAGAFNTSFKLIFPDAQHLECSQHVSRAVDYKANRDGFYKKIVKQQIFPQVAKRDVLIMHLAKTAMREQVCDASLDGWRYIYEEPKAADHVGDNQLKKRHDQWHYSATTGYPGFCECP
jgi:hypothetical protein